MSQTIDSTEFNDQPISEDKRALHAQMDAALTGWPAMDWPPEPIRPEPPTRREMLTLRVLIVAAALSLIGFCAWLLGSDRIGDPIVYWGLTAALLLRGICWLLEWFNYWAILIPPVLRPRRRWTVDVLTTACPGEPAGMIIRTLKAMVAIQYPHTNYLCDEGNDPFLKKVCEDLGVVHVTRTIKKHAKAGNINNALSQATGQLSVVLDPDHEPSPYMLERTLGYFEDPAVGFVQSVQGYRNQSDSFVAQGAAEQSYHFYGPTMMGMHGHGTTQAIGANCVFRRAALDSIGGHASGLAEDMHTSMRLYSKGWRSVYVPEILTRGLVPNTLSGFYKQQIKWACGAFDLLFQEYPSLFRGFTLRQKLHYFLCPFFFLRGLVGLLEMVVPITCLAYGLVAWRATTAEILMWFIPVLVFGTLVRMRVQKWVMEPHERGFHFAGGFLAIATWWVYLIGVICAVLRIKVPYIPTPKEDKPVDAGDITLPNFLCAGVLITAAVIGVYRDSSPPSILMAALAVTNSFALIFVSIAAQQVTLRKFWSSLAALRKPLRPANRTVKPMARGLYEGLLHQGREALILPGLLCLLIVVGTGYALFAPSSHETETPFALRKEMDVGGFYTGVDLGGVGTSQQTAQCAALQQQLDFRFRMIALDLDWNSITPFPLDTLKQLRRNGSIPMINWLPKRDPLSPTGRVSTRDRTILRAIGEGVFDLYLKKFAHQVRLFGEPVMLNFAPQGDNPKMPWSQTGGNTAKDYIAAWHHVVAVFEEEGAANVGWVWTSTSAEHVGDYFPSPDGGYVDWVNIAVDSAQRPTEAYETVRPKIADYHLPVMLSGLSPNTANPAWAPTAVADAVKQYPEVKAALFQSSLPSSGSDAAPIASTLKQALKLTPFATGTGEDLAKQLPMWFDLHSDQALPSYIEGGPGHFQMIVDGKPFYIKGIAYNPGHDWRDANVPLSRRELDADFDAIAKMGGNTIRRYGRTWSDRNIFNAANDHGVKVLFGFWFDQDIDYITNTGKMASFESQIDRTVADYRDHPGLLGWSLGNETWGLLKHTFGQPYLTQQRHAYTLFVERMAKKVKTLDPNHPIFSAQESKGVAGAMNDYGVAAPTVDVLAINSYYERDISNLSNLMTRLDPNRPYLVSEFGPDGYWDTDSNHYDSQHGILEATALEKAWQYANRWRQHIAAHAGTNIGGIAYCWSDRYEGTATWFGIMDLDRRPKPSYIALKMAWWNPDPKLGGNFPYGGPRIAKVTYPETPQWPGEPFVVKADIELSAKEQPKYEWSVTGPGFDTDAGKIETLDDGSAASIRLPSTPGWYRVQLKVIGQWGMDEANVPVKVVGDAADVMVKRSEGNQEK